MIDEEIVQYIRAQFTMHPEIRDRDQQAESIILRRSKVEYMLWAASLSGKEKLWLASKEGCCCDGRHYKLEIDVGIFSGKAFGWAETQIGDKVLRTSDALYSLILLNLYSNINGISLDEAVIELERKLSPTYVDTSPEEHWGLREKWSPGDATCKKTDKSFHFYNSRDENVGFVAGFIQNSKWIFLPNESALHQVAGKIRYIIQENFFLPLEKPTPLFNSHLLSLRKSNSPNVFLTDALEVAEANQRLTNDKTWLSWYGGKAALDDYDWTPLAGRTVYYLLINHYLRKGPLPYKTALAVYQKLIEAKVKEVIFISSFDDHYLALPNGIFQQTIVFDFSEAADLLPIMQAALNKGVKARVSLRTAEKRNEFLLRPAIPKTPSLTLMYGNPDTARSWLPLSMAFAISEGKPFVGDWGPSSPCPVLYLNKDRDCIPFTDKLALMPHMYINGNTSGGVPSFHYRQPEPKAFDPEDVLSGQCFSSLYPPFQLFSLKPSPFSNFKFHWFSSREEDIDLASELGQKAVEMEIKTIKRNTFSGISLLVLDGMPALQRLFGNIKLLRGFCTWLEKMRAQGLSVWVVPPGEIMGPEMRSELKKLPFDVIFRLDREWASLASEIHMSIHVERSVPPLAIASLRVKLNMAAPVPFWRQCANQPNLSREDKIEWIRHLIFVEGLTGSQIEAKTGIKETTVKKYRKQGGMSMPCPAKGRRRPKQTP